VVADQSDEATVYRVFDRATLKEAGAFTGQKTRESDGIAILGADPGGASSGTFFAVYDGRAVAAIGKTSPGDWGFAAASERRRSPALRGWIRGDGLAPGMRTEPVCRAHAV